MKKLILLFIFFIFFTSLISAISIETDSEFDKGETLLAKISGNFIDSIQTNNVVFYRGHVQIPLDFDVVKQGEDFYIYALLLNKEKGNYSFEISDVRYYKGTEIIDDTIIQNFSISNNLAEFSVNPGFITTKDNFEVKLQNLQEKKITVNIETSNRISAEESVELKEGESKSVDFILDMPMSEENIIFTSENYSYEFKAFIIKSEEKIEKDYDIDFETKVVDISMATESDGKRVIYLKNTGKDEIEKVNLSISSILEPYVTLSIYSIKDFKVNKSEKIEIFIISDIEEAVFEGEIIAYAQIENQTLKDSATIIIEFMKDFVPTEEYTEDTPSTDKCSDVGGEICSGNQECGGEIFYASDGVCCLGSCQDVETSSIKKWVGWTLIIVLVLGVYWFYKKKYKKAK